VFKDVLRRMSWVKEKAESCQTLEAEQLKFA